MQGRVWILVVWLWREPILQTRVSFSFFLSPVSVDILSMLHVCSFLCYFQELLIGMSQMNHPQGQQNLETALSWHKTCHINKNIRQEKAKHLTKSQKHIWKMVHVHICPKKLCFARKNWHIAAESEPSCTIGKRISQKVE